MSSLRKYLPNLRRQRSSEDAATTTSEEQVDVKREKSAGDSDSEDLVVDPATAADPELNPGGLSLEEGVYFIRTFRVQRDDVQLVRADAAGGMGRHLGVFSCTLLMCVCSRCA